MSYDIYFHENDEIVTVPPVTTGGTLKFVKPKEEDLCPPNECTECENTRMLGLVPSTDAELNVTFNYSSYFSWRGLNGKTGEEARPELKEAIGRLGTKRDDDYWAKTPGNAGYALNTLLTWTKVNPRGVFTVH